MLINPQAATIDGTIVTVYRTFPAHGLLGVPRPLVSYRETVTPLDNGRTCGDGRTQRYVRPGDFGRWDIAEWAAPCMRGAWLWHAEWQGWLFGLIPLQPVSLTIIGSGTGD